MSKTAILAVLLTACIDTAGTTTTTPEPATTIPGTEVESSFAPDARLGLIGAEMDIPHRLAPTPGETVTGPKLQPTEDRLVAAGIARQVDDVVWERMRLGREEGYLPRSKVGFIGEPEDVTHLYAGVTGDTVQGLAYQIAAEIEASRIVLVAQPDTNEAVYDVVGIDDDSVAGFRVRVVVVEAGDELTPRLVERTPLCSRGVSDDGMCT